MADQSFSTAPAPAAGRKLNIPILAVAGIFVLLILILGGVVLRRFLSGRQPAPDTNIAVIRAGKVGVPVYPDAVLQEGYEDVTDILISPAVYQAPAAADEVMTWYRDTMPGRGFAVIDDYSDDGAEGGVIRFEHPSEDVAVDLQVWMSGEAACFSLVAGFSGEGVSTAPEGTEINPAQRDTMPPGEISIAESPPAAGETGVAGEAEAPALAASPAMTMTQPVTFTTPLSGSGFSLEVAAMTDAPLYAGSLNRISYRIDLRGEGGVVLTATLPAGVHLPPQTGFYYDPAYSRIILRVELAPDSPRAFTIPVVTDLFIEPGELVFKVVAKGEQGQTSLNVAKLEVAPYGNPEAISFVGVGNDGLPPSAPPSSPSPSSPPPPSTGETSSTAPPYNSGEMPPIYPGAVRLSWQNQEWLNNALTPLQSYRITDTEPVEVARWYEETMPRQGFVMSKNNLEGYIGSVEFTNGDTNVYVSIQPDLTAQSTTDGNGTVQFSGSMSADSVVLGVTTY